MAEWRCLSENNKRVKMALLYSWKPTSRALGHATKGVTDSVKFTTASRLPSSIVFVVKI
jgi:hypothetical protein